MSQKDRKTGKKRGSRTHGYGNAKKHRGAGSRGGRGMAGSGKHKQIKVLIEDPNRFGKKGFNRHPSLKKTVKSINLGDIQGRLESWSEKGLVRKEKNVYKVNLGVLGYDKVLSAGELSVALEVKANAFSKSAIKKIEKAGGKVLEE